MSPTSRWQRRPAENRMQLTTAAVVAFLMCGLIAACGGNDDDDVNGAPADAVIGWSNPNAANPILNALTAGAEQVAEVHGWELNEFDAGLDPDTQLSDINTMVAQNVDALITWTLDPRAVESAYRNAAEEGLPIVAFNSESEFFNTVVETDVSARCDPFEDAAQYIAEERPNARILVIGGPPVPALQMRVECFRDAAEAEGLEVIDQQDNLEDSIDGGNQIVSDLLTRHGDDVDAVWAYNDRTALGASRAIAGGGLDVAAEQGDDGVILIGCNGDPEAIDAILDGELTLTYDENPPEAGAVAAEALLAVLAEGGSVDDMPRTVLVESTRWDSANADQYVPWTEREVGEGEFDVEVQVTP